MAAPLYITNSAQVSNQFIHLLANIHLLIYFFIVVILVGMEWCLTVVFTCISLTTNSVEYIFMGFSDICICLWRKVYSDPIVNLTWVVYYFVNQFLEVLNISWILNFYELYEL